MTTASAAIAKPSRRRSTLNRQRSIAGFLFVLPAVLFTLAMFIFPLLMTVWMSLHDWPLLGQATFWGFRTTWRWRDKQFWASLWFTTQYTLLVTPAIFILAFALALLVNTALRGIGVFRTIYFIPVVIGLGASSLLWVWLLNDRVGIINGLLLDLGLIERPIIWFVDKNLALAVIIISVVWKTVGFSMILLLAGMQAIPEELYQAAMVDGANYRQRLTHIMMPLLRSTFALALVLSVIGSYLSFDQFYIMTRGGPQNQTITAVYWIFNNSFTYYKMGYGAALSIILLIILGALSILQLRILRDDVTY
ncbi:MAG: sugar ABC transporter permease [Anaerolineales bacterium]|nr:sugar ABC transporter permease [Anaerolineales bacterium]